MFRLTLKNLRANKVRFALTTFGVMLAVSFVVSAFVLGDGLRSTFGGVADETTAGIDLQARPVADFGDPPPLSADLVDVVADVEGVADAAPGIEAGWDVVQLLGEDGKPVSSDGPPHIAYAWSDNSQLSAFSLMEGAPPGLDQFTIDLDAAAKYDLVIGESYELTTPTGRKHLMLSGTSSFGADNETVGAVLMQMNADQAGDLFGIDGVNTISIQVDNNADIAAVQAAVQAAVPQTDVVDNAVVAADANEELTGEIDVVGNILLGFGGVALFVSIFIIYNTFAIVLGQRTQELALLRTIGADPTQIRRSVLGEALVIGLLASGGGIAGGVGVSKGLEALFNATGGSLPDSPTIIATRTIVAALVIGVGVTMLAAIGPARRAGTVPAIAALRGGAEASAPGSRTRIVSGTGMFAAGLVAGATGLAGAGSTAATVALMAGGAVGIFLGVTILSPMVVGVITRVLAWPLTKISGVAGRLAQQNAARNSRRTATTAAALMIGLALVSTALIVGQSIKQSMSTTLEESATADYYLTDQLEETTFPLGVPADLDANDVFDSVSGFRYVETRVNGEIGTNVAADFDQLPPLLNADVRDGGYDLTVTNPVLIASKHAESTGLGVGDTVTTEFANGAAVDATITGVFHDEALITADFLFDESAFDSAGDLTGYEWVAISLSEGADQGDVEAAIAAVSSEFPAADVETTQEFQDRTVGMIDDVLAIVNIMVALAVIIALIGIANTLALSVFERTRELGLIRAVGMTKRQLRRMVRFEAALVATFGAVLGVSIGLLFGWGIVEALPASFASSLAIPVQSIAVLVIVAATAGVLAAVLPARRAGRLNVLDAISH
jgi:putative ABC transport system permease protein